MMFCEPLVIALHTEAPELETNERCISTPGLSVNTIIRKAGTQPTEQLFSKSILWVQTGIFPPGDPSVEAGGFAPHLN
jgi:hypothetical protein